MAAAYVEDVLLVDRCLTGEPAATRELFRRHRSRVHACLYRVLGGTATWTICCKRRFSRCSSRCAAGAPRRASRRGSIASRCASRIAISRSAAGACRPRRSTTTRTSAGAHEVGPGARRQLARDGVKRLYAVLDELSPAARLAFTLHEIDGRPLAEVAKLVGSIVTATKLRVWRARKRIEAAAAADPVLASSSSPVATCCRSTTRRRREAARQDPGRAARRRAPHEHRAPIVAGAAERLAACGRARRARGFGLGAAGAFAAGAALAAWSSAVAHAAPIAARR